MSKPLSFISSDSHVIEPADLWTSRIGKKFGERAPRVVDSSQGELFLFEGMPPAPVAAFGVAGENPADYKEVVKGGYKGVPSGGWDPVQRLKDQERDGVSGEFIYPSFGMTLYGLKDAELRTACFKAYNDWVAEYCAAAPSRLAGAAMIPLEDVDVACAELERAAGLGLKGGMITGLPSPDRRYDQPLWDPMWAMAERYNMPLSLHVITEQERSGIPQSTLKEYPLMFLAPMRSITDIIFGGALERFPDLKIVLAENDIGWLAHYLQRMDHSYEKYRFLEDGKVIPEPPTYYFKRQIYCTFQDDEVGVLTRHHIGVDRLMWASDFPHSDSTWPQSREVVAREFKGVPENEVRQIVHDNCAKLYGFAA